MSLLIIDQITKEYRNQIVLNKVSLRVEKGERVALIGPNGAGKTTLMKIVMGMEDADNGRVVIARNARVGYLSQYIDDEQTADKTKTTAVHYEKVYKLEKKLRQLEKQLSCQTDADSKEFEKLMYEYERALARYEAIDGYNVEVKLKKTLYHLGLRMEALATPVEKLSGGERMRAAVTRIMLEEPDLLLLDEPTNHLDIRATEWFEKFLSNFQGGVLFVSHDRYFLNQVATRVAELDNGMITVRSGSYADYIKHKKQLADFILSEQHRLRWTIKNERRIVQSLKSQRKSRAVKSRQHRITKLKNELNTTLAAVKEQEHLFQSSGPKISFKKVKHVSKRIAWAEDVQKSFGDLTIFSGADFQIHGGERVGIIGPNGCGKTTLINMLLGKDRDYRGTIELGSWVNCAYMGQEVLFENENLTALEFITTSRDIIELDAKSHLARFQFYGDDVDKKIRILSGGERVQLYLACAMLENPDCFILDEPTNHLDMLAREAVEKALREFNGTIIAVTHDRQYLTNCVTKILEIEDGKITTYEGNYEQYKRLKQENDEEEGLPSQPRKTQMQQKSKDSISKKQSLDPILKEIESQLLVLEEKAKQMEESFTESTTVAEYQEYGQLLKEIELVYEKWGLLIEE